MLMFRSTHRKLVEVLMTADRERAAMHRDLIQKLKDENKLLHKRLGLADAAIVRLGGYYSPKTARYEFAPLRSLGEISGRAVIRRVDLDEGETIRRREVVHPVSGAGASGDVTVITIGSGGAPSRVEESEARPAEKSTDKSSGSIGGDTFETGGSFGGESFSTGSSSTSSSSSSSDSGSSSSSDGGGGSAD